MLIMIAEASGGELFSIRTVEPYPDNYNDTVDVGQTEKNNGIHPELATHIENLDQYDTIFVGFQTGGMLPQRLLILFWRVMISQVKPSFLLLLLAAAAWETQMKNLHRAVLALS